MANCSPVLDFVNDGIEIRKALLTARDIALIKSDIDLDSVKLKKYGVRNLEKRFSSISMLVQNDILLSIAKELLGSHVNLVRALFFDKTPEKNWFVTWHQDKTVTLNKQMNLEGWGPWSVKDGVCHVQPPVAVLDTMLTFRLHLDPADEENGCLKVIPETHRYGILGQSRIDEIVSSENAVACVVEAGDAVIMRPHILHSSSKAKQPGHRRVVHIEYSSYVLPDGTSWA